MILAEVTFIPVDVGTSGSRYVKIALGIFKDEGISYYPNSMGTVLEDESMDRILDVIKKAESEIIRNGVKRLETAIKIDHRVDVENSVSRKLKSIGVGN
ncbi:hypothetical protein IX51_08370 [uncultured archaeon]|nr:hypothetical protein IX51_08370 [uncultured archaeon]